MNFIAGRYIVTLLLCLLQLSIELQAQEIKLAYFRTKDRVLLRWAPANSADWQLSRHLGITLERLTVSRDSARVYPVEINTIRSGIVPAKLEGWEKAYSTDKYAALAAQALYGGSFSINLNTNSENPIDIIHKAEDLESRFSYLLLACDQSFQTALLAGLAYDDSLVHDGEAYLYKLYFARGEKKSDTTYVFVPPQESGPLPVIKDFQGRFGDHAVELSWPTDPYYDFYTSYVVEFSKNGSDFSLLDSLSSIQTFNIRGSTERFVRMVRLADIESDYGFRIRGKNAFGMLGPPSNLIKGRSISATRLNIFLTEENVSAGKITMRLNLEDSSSVERMQFGSSVLSKSRDGENFKDIVVNEGLNLTYEDTDPDPAAYYKVKVDFSNTLTAETPPILIQLPDSIPPATPGGIQGKCDSLGNIHVYWQRNSEKDINGYRLYRSRLENGEYRQLTKAAIGDTLFIDSIGLATPATSYYYKVQAEDKRFNRSELSRSIEVASIDQLPPLPPRIVGYEVEDGVVRIEWVPSSSGDATYTLTRECQAELKYFEIDITREMESQFFEDSSSCSGISSYVLIVKHSLNGSRNFSNEIKVTNQNTRDKIIDLFVDAIRHSEYIQLSWQTTYNYDQVIIYRSSLENNFAMIKSLDNSSQLYLDYNVEVGNIYNYLIRMVDNENHQFLTSSIISIYR